MKWKYPYEDAPYKEHTVHHEVWIQERLWNHRWSYPYESYYPDISDNKDKR